MLRNLLRLVAERGMVSDDELARALDTPPPLVDLMLDELLQRGYLEAVGPGCAAPCAHCPLHAACLYRRQTRLWMLTARGAQALKS